MRRVPSAVGFDGCDKNGHGTDSYATALPSPAALPALLRPSMQLLTIEAAPPHVRSEFVLYHYRPTCTTWRAAALTLFRLHNETLNIWSHLLGAAWVVAMLLETQSMAVTDEGQRFATVVFLLSALFCTAASSLYHLFGGVLSPSRYSQLYKLDINGISVVIAGSYYPGLRFAFRCHPWTYGAYAWSTLVLLLAAAYTANFEVPDVMRVATQALPPALPPVLPPALPPVLTNSPGSFPLALTLALPS